MNPLLADDELPRFDAIEPAHLTPAIDTLLAAAEAALAHAVGPEVPDRYRALGIALDIPVERLQRTWSIAVHLHAVVDTPALREAFNHNLPRMIDFATRLTADAALFAKTRAIAAEDPSLDAVQRKAVADALRDFVLGGAELEGAARQRFAELSARSAKLSQRFGENVLDATDAWSLVVDEAALDGVPADVIAQARQAAERDGVAGCKLTLHGPCREPILRHATNRALRETVFNGPRRAVQRCRPGRVAQRAADGRADGLARRRGRAARPRRLRDAVAGQQDGRQPAGGDGLPARTGRARAALRPGRVVEAADLRGGRAGPGPAPALGSRLRQRAAEAGPSRRRRRHRAPLLPGAARARRLPAPGRGLVRPAASSR